MLWKLLTCEFVYKSNFVHFITLWNLNANNEMTLTRLKIEIKRFLIW